jgi:tRNA pseudouridine55 synthase
MPISAGILAVDKPRGPTSHDVVARLRRTLRTKHIGHCGTLDPMATGVLVLAIGEGTKLVPWLTADDKVYEASIRLGAETDSLDADGTVTRHAELEAALTAELAELEADPNAACPRIRAAVLDERDRTTQIPPTVSAIRIGGRRAHELVRQGETPELPPRECSVRRLLILGGGLQPEPHLRVLVDVTKGYFVRSLARDLAARLGTFGHLNALRRTHAGNFGLDDCVLPSLSLEELRPFVLGLAAAASRALPVSVLSPDGVFAAARGQRLMPTQLVNPHPSPSAWIDDSGTLIAIGQVESDGGGRVLRGFTAPASEAGRESEA